MKDSEYPNALRAIADKLENDFNGNINDSAEDLYEISTNLVMRKDELLYLGLDLQSFFNDIADFSCSLKDLGN